MKASLFRLAETKWMDLFMLYYGITVSRKFLDCADQQLSIHFEELTKIDIKRNHIWINFEPESDYSKIQGKDGNLYGNLNFKYGVLPVKIYFKSKKKDVLQMDKENFDCSDLVFDFNHLDIQLCEQLIKPTWTLFPLINRHALINLFFSSYSLKITNSFLDCADKQLTEKFRILTGIKVDRNILLWPDKNSRDVFADGVSSGIWISIIVNEHAKPVKLMWKSKSGEIFPPDHIVYDCDDLIFWLENIDIHWVYEKYLKSTIELKLPSKLTYTLEVYKINTHCQLKIDLLRKDKNSSQKFITLIDDFISAFNRASEADHRKSGVVHNWQRVVKHDRVYYEIDTGSAGLLFVKKLLVYFSELGMVDSAVLG